MLTVDEARALVIEHTKPLAPVETPLNKAQGLVLATPVLAPFDLPVFDNSAMDGYAIGDLESASWQVIGEIQAGDDAATTTLLPGQCVRIFTGAPAPASAAAVVMQEHVELTEASITLTGPAPKPGQHIRRQGEELKATDVALLNGTRLSPAGLGFMAMLGKATANVRPRPKVHLVTTGNELVAPGKPLGPGQIYESNSAALGAAAAQAGAAELKVFTVSDSLEATKTQLEEAISNADVLLISGGISVGDYDFVGAALEAIGVEKVFHKVLQRPGKPLFFGKRGNTLVFALPGNPASALVCFYEYVYPALRKLTGHQKLQLQAAEFPLRHSFQKKPGRAWFVRALASNEGVQSLEGQGSHMMRSFAEANALIFLPTEVESLPKGAPVEVHLLPH